MYNLLYALSTKSCKIHFLLDRQVRYRFTDIIPSQMHGTVTAANNFQNNVGGNKVNYERTKG